jgi:hypothetical protein
MERNRKTGQVLSWTVAPIEGGGGGEEEEEEEERKDENIPVYRLTICVYVWKGPFCSFPHSQCLSLHFSQKRHK